MNEKIQKDLDKIKKDLETINYNVTNFVPNEDYFDKKFKKIEDKIETLNRQVRGY